MFESIIKELHIFIFSMLPFSELRLTVPLGIGLYEFSFWKTFALAVSGNFLILVFAYQFFDKIIVILRKLNPKFGKLIDYILEKARSKHGDKFKIKGAIMLVSFVGLPLPGTGGWTGIVLAYIFDIPKKDTFRYIFLGLCISALIMGLLSMGVISIF